MRPSTITLLALLSLSLLHSGCLMPGDVGATSDLVEEVQEDLPDDTTTGCDCGEGELCCAGKCVDPTGNLNCGTCGNTCQGETSCANLQCVCPGDERLCDDKCVTLTSDPENCGACGTTCLPHLSCRDGACRCVSGMNDCGGDCVNLEVSHTNCGACGNACPPNASCINGRCQAACGPQEVDCGGYCAVLDSNLDHCGACDQSCDPGERCEAGFCRCGQANPSICDLGKACCDFECKDLNTIANCGGCGNACRPGESCVDQACRCGDGASCGGDDYCCEGQCSSQACSGCEYQCGEHCLSHDDLMKSAEHCGSCFNDCGAQASCSDGECICANERANCDDTPGCETPLGTETNCATCGDQCDQGEACIAGECLCGSSTCLSNQRCCNGSCVDIDINSCESCGEACPTPPHAVVSCDLGACVFSCSYPWEDCDGEMAVNGCETDLESSSIHCGACEESCSPDKLCLDGTCSCHGGMQTCGVDCVKLEEDPDNCGACGTLCPDNANCISGDCICKDTQQFLCMGAGGLECRDFPCDDCTCGVTEICCGGACYADPSKVTVAYCQNCTNDESCQLNRSTCNYECVGVSWEGG